MNQPGPDIHTLSLFGDFIREKLGLSYSARQMDGLWKHCCAVADAFNIQNVNGFLRDIMAQGWSDPVLREFIERLTVSETYFFRHLNDLEALVNFIFSRIHSSNTDSSYPVRVWSAGCSTGEEIYSIYMLFEARFGWQLARNLHSCGTDLNQKSIDKASEGVYREWSFRDTKGLFKDRYFTAGNKDEYRIDQNVRDQVNFNTLNLMDDSWPECFGEKDYWDVILCRNVFIYFDPPTVETLLKRFRRALKPDGRFIVSAAELGFIPDELFQSVDGGNLCLLAPASEKPRVRNSGGRKSMDRQQVGPSSHHRKKILKKFPEKYRHIKSLNQTSAPVVRSRKNNSNRQVDAAWSKQVGQAIKLGDRESLMKLLSGEFSRGIDYCVLLTRLSRERCSEYALLYATLLADQGDISEATFWCRKVLETDKVNARACFLMASLEDSQDSFESAEEFYRKVIYLEPENVMAHFQLGSLLLRSGDKYPALKSLGNALAVIETLPGDVILDNADGIHAGRLKDLITLSIEKANKA